MKKRFWTLRFWVFFGITLVILATVGRNQAEKMITHRLQKMALKQDNQIYHYELGGFDLNFFSRELSLQKVKIIPKQSYLNSLKRIGKAKPSVYSITLEKISIQDLNPIRILFSKTIDIGKIRFESPKILFFKADSSIAENDQIVSRISHQKRLFSDLVDGVFNQIKISEIDINQANTKYYKVNKTDTSLLMQSEESNFKIYGIATDQELIRSSEIFKYDSTSFELKNTQWEGLADYHLSLGSFQKNSDQDHLIFKNIQIAPREDKFSFMEHQVQEVDWYRASIEEITILNFDISAFQRNKSLNSSAVSIKGADLEIYRDKRLKDQATLKPLPGSLLKEMETDLAIGQIKVNDSRIDYYEWELHAKKPIHAEIDDMSLEIQNLSNTFQNLIESDIVTLQAEAYLMDKGKIALQAQFFLADTNDRFKLSTRIEKIPLPALNPILKESAFIEFQDGELNWLQMEMEGDKQSSKSKMDLEYSNMKHFDLLRGMDELKVQKEKGHHVRRKRKFLSFIIREVIPNNYGPETKNYETVEYTVKRDRQKSIINYLVENLKSGTKSHLEPDFLKKDN